MMSSVIPARLEYQCGHAAIVSLPRIKGETSAQRNARVVREKSAALERQCDFCAPVVVELIAAVPPESVPAPADMPLSVVAIETVEPGADGHQADGSVLLIEAIEPATVEPFAEVVEVAVLEPVVVVEPVATAANGSRIKRRYVRRAARARTPQPVTALRNFLVEYRAERVIQAVDVRDALRQVASLGATDVLEIARQD
jgi:hypothetical protein